MAVVAGVEGGAPVNSSSGPIVHSQIGRRMFAIADALNTAGLRFAFGGAIALAYHIDNPRATTDIDIDILIVPTKETVARIVDAFGKMFVVPESKAQELLAVGQVRLMWDDVPIDVFTHTHDFHADIEKHLEYVPFEGRTIPILSATHLAVFKAFFDRPKDWIDIQEMAYRHTFPKSEIIGWLRVLLGDDYRIGRIQALQSSRPPEPTFKQIVENAKFRE
jgi:hypothetical protein